MADPHPGVSASEQDAIDDSVAVEAATRAAGDATSVYQCKIDAKAATDLDAQVIAVAPFAGTVTTVELVPNAAVTGDNTNTRSFALTNKGLSGAGTTSVATLALTTGNNLVAFDAKPMTLSVVAGALTVAIGDVLSLAQTVGASGLAHSGGILRIVFTRS